MNKKLFQEILAVIFIVLLTACSASAPPTELAPGGPIVAHAIAFQLEQTQTSLSQQLELNTPELTISNINVNKLEPIFINQLPAYHLVGTYNLKMKFSRQEVKLKNDPFEIYLQRQAEGKTWRLLRKKITNSTQKVEWLSYLIPQSEEET
jgi:hypothetical protein